jgi:hypothetical protein
MKTLEQTPEKLKAGVGILTNQATILQLNTPTIEILIGGPYKLRNGESHSYGHAALRAITATDERIYDFGRYGATKGLFGAQGEGILRVWDKFETYIGGENAYGRNTTGFSYLVSNEKSLAVIRYFEKITSGATERTAKHPHQKEFKLSKDYDAIDNNCATTTLSGAKIALPTIDAEAAQYNIGRGMSDVEKTAAKTQNFGWPSHIFMPADVQAMLEKNKKIIPKKVTIYGNGGK